MEHPRVAHEYGELKSKLAILYPNSIDNYCDVKDEFIKKLELTALVWYKNKKNTL